MLRKVYLGIVISLLATSGWTTGFYIGAGLGPDLATFTDNATVRESGGGNVGLNVRNREQLSGVGIFGSLFAGYGMTFNNFNMFSPQLNSYLALEINGNLSSLEHKNSNDEYVHNSFSHTKFRMQDNYGISILPGLMYANNTLFFGRLGYDNSNFKISTTDVSLGRANKRIGGFRWGLGTRRFVTPQVAIGLEFSQTAYNDVKTSTLTAVSKITRITPRKNQTEFSLLYQFC